MSIEPTLDIEVLTRWIGSTANAEDMVTPGLVERFRATFDLPHAFQEAAGEDLPPSIVWCLAPSVAATATLGPDGHPTRGGFLPPVSLPRRMWAGGELLVHAPIRAGDLVQRRSVITDVRLREGRSGRLCFVTIRHEYRAGNAIAVTETQDIVYRDVDRSKQEAAQTSSGAEPRAAELTRSIRTSPTLLFRYSALTFNGHRIHYDRTYCQTEEGYPALVVHGPLQATCLHLLARERAGRWPAAFAFRGVKPLFDGTMTVNARASAEDRMELFCANEEGQITMSAEASW